MEEEDQGETEKPSHKHRLSSISRHPCVSQPTTLGYWRKLESVMRISEDSDSAGGGNREVHDTGVRRGGPAVLAATITTIISNARGGSGRHGQIHPDGSGFART